MLTLTTDASDKAIGGVLHDNRKDGTSVPLAFFSRKLQVAERSYSVFDKEMLANFAAKQKFRRYIGGRHCVVLTDKTPKGKWFCPTCRESRRTKTVKFNCQFDTPF